LFAELREGWIEIIPENSYVNGFTLVGDGQLTYMDGSCLPSATDTTLVFPEIRNLALTGESTRYFLVNPNPQQSEITFKWLQSADNVIQVRKMLPPYGAITTSFSSLFGSGESGYVTVSSGPGRTIAGMELFGTDTSIGGLSGIPESKAAATLFGAQFSSGQGTETVIKLVNLGEQDEVRVEVFSDASELLASVTQTVPASSAIHLTGKDLVGLSSALKTGWFKVRSTKGNLIGSLSFENSDGTSLAALPLQYDGAREFVLSHVAQDQEIFTGVTLLNPNAEAALVSIEVFNQAGARVGSRFLVLAAEEKKALLLNEWIPGMDHQIDGFIRIRSTMPIYGFELFGAWDGAFLSAVPSQVLVY
jgi:hypothetical protein